MTADTKRGATAYEKAVRHMQWGFGMSEPDAKRAMAAILDAGLHVVTDADKAVLDAAAAIHPRALVRPLQYTGDWEEFVDAELARRGLK